jgi:hypothetical protein
MRLERWLYTIPLRLRSVFWRRRVDEELDAELRYHMEHRTEENIASGMLIEDARRAAVLEMHGIERTKEECRDARHVTWLEDLAQDLRYGLRILRKSPASPVCPQNSDCFAKSATCRNPTSGRLCHVNWTHDPVSSGVSFFVRCLLPLAT